jgi:hypothetical protein
VCQCRSWDSIEPRVSSLNDLAWLPVLPLRRVCLCLSANGLTTVSTQAISDAILKNGGLANALAGTSLAGLAANLLTAASKTAFVNAVTAGELQIVSNDFPGTVARLIPLQLQNDSQDPTKNTCDYPTGSTPVADSCSACHFSEYPYSHI